jgi:hypothetical protein
VGERQRLIVLSMARAILSTAVAMTAGGCFFECPIDPTASVEVDRALLGTWRCLGFDAGPTSQPANFIVRAADDKHYVIVFDEGEGTVEEYSAHTSLVRGKVILNVRVPKPKAGLKPWTLARYSFLRRDVAQVELVDEDKLEGSDRSPASLRQAVEKVDEQGGLWGDYCVCVRVKRPAQTSAEPPSRRTRG